MKIIVGSTSPHKIGGVSKAVDKVFSESPIEVRGFKASSRVREQPMGFPETLQGAKNRARHAWEQDQEAVAIGIESGIMLVPLEEHQYSIDLAVVYLLSPTGWYTITTSTGIEFVTETVGKALDMGITAGALIAKELNGDASDCTSSLTKGRLSRMDTFVQAVELALIRYALAH